MRILCFVSICVISLYVPLYMCIVLASIYALRWFAWEMLIVALFFDMYFGVGHAPWYSLSMFCTLIVVELIKPRFSFYTE